MEPQIEDKYPDMNVDDAAAALGFSTTLSDTMLQPMLDAENMPVEDDADPAGEEMTEGVSEEPTLRDKFGKKEEPEEDAQDVRKIIHEEISDLKDMIADALAQEDDDEEINEDEE